MDIEVFSKDWRGPYSFFDTHKHPDCPVTVNYYDGRCGELHSCCPYCGYKLDRWDLSECLDGYNWETDEEEHAIDCPECELEYNVTCSFGHGISTTTIKCRYHTPIFTEQYSHEGKIIRIAKCVKCTHTVKYHSSKFQLSIDPATFPEFHDPDYWDPDNLLVPDEPVTTLPTPILDEIYNQGHGYTYTGALLRALKDHDNAWN